MTREISVTLYKLNELPKETQQKVIDAWRCDSPEYHWVREWEDTLRAFAKYFDLTINDYEISPYHSSNVDWDFTYEYRDHEAGERTHDIAGDALATVLKSDYLKKDLLAGNAPFTGYIGDEITLDAIREYMATSIKHPGYTFQDLMQDCIDNWLKGVIEDMEYQDSDEYVREEIENNDYEFTADGVLHG